jgi:hypothetical protein
MKKQEGGIFKILNCILDTRERVICVGICTLRTQNVP